MRISRCAVLYLLTSSPTSDAFTFTVSKSQRKKTGYGPGSRSRSSSGLNMAVGDELEGIEQELARAAEKRTQLEQELTSMTRQGRSTNNGYNNNNDDPYSYMQQQPKLDVAVGEEAGVGLGAIGTVGSVVAAAAGARAVLQNRQEKLEEEARLREEEFLKAQQAALSAKSATSASGLFGGLAAGAAAVFVGIGSINGPPIEIDSETEYTTVTEVEESIIVPEVSSEALLVPEKDTPVAKVKPFQFSKSKSPPGYDLDVPDFATTSESTVEAKVEEEAAPIVEAEKPKPLLSFFEKKDVPEPVVVEESKTEEPVAVVEESPPQAVEEEKKPLLSIFEKKVEPEPIIVEEPAAVVEDESPPPAVEEEKKPLLSIFEKKVEPEPAIVEEPAATVEEEKKPFQSVYKKPESSASDKTINALQAKIEEKSTPSVPAEVNAVQDEPVEVKQSEDAVAIVNNEDENSMDMSDYALAYTGGVAAALVALAVAATSGNREDTIDASQTDKGFGRFSSPPVPPPATGSSPPPPKPEEAKEGMKSYLENITGKDSTEDKATTSDGGFQVTKPKWATEKKSVPGSYLDQVGNSADAAENTIKAVKVGSADAENIVVAKKVDPSPTPEPEKKANAPVADSVSGSYLDQMGGTSNAPKKEGGFKVTKPKWATEGEKKSMPGSYLDQVGGGSVAPAPKPAVPEPIASSSISEAKVDPPASGTGSYLDQMSGASSTPKKEGGFKVTKPKWASDSEKKSMPGSYLDQVGGSSPTPAPEPTASIPALDPTTSIPSPEPVVSFPTPEPAVSETKSDSPFAGSGGSSYLERMSGTSSVSKNEGGFKVTKPKWATDSEKKSVPGSYLDQVGGSSPTPAPEPTLSESKVDSPSVSSGGSSYLERMSGISGGQKAPESEEKVMSESEKKWATMTESKSAPGSYFDQVGGSSPAPVSEPTVSEPVVTSSGASYLERMSSVSSAPKTESGLETSEPETSATPENESAGSVSYLERMSGGIAPKQEGGFKPTGGFKVTKPKWSTNSGEKKGGIPGSYLDNM